MLIVRAPLRVSLFGGGTDFPDYYSSYPARTISFALNKYIYTTAHPLSESGDILLKYSQYERVPEPKRIIHPAFREVLSHYQIQSIDISVTSDVPAGTGLGSSSAFLVSLLKLISEFKDQDLTQEKIAEMACYFELERLKEPIGKQDQYASSLGGFNSIVYSSDGSVKVETLPHELHSFTKYLALVRITGTRSASELLSRQIRSENRIDSLHEISRIAHGVKISDFNSPKKIGELLKYSWEAKRNISPEVSNPYIEKVFSECMNLGAFGGKLLGAGSSGYLLVIGPEGISHELATKTRYVVTQPSIDVEGVKTIYSYKGT